MHLLSTLLAFIVALGVLIVFHEFGHYFVARLCNVKVLRFSVGFGAPLWTRRYGADGTEWAIGRFPLGGYVKMLDEREAPVPDAERHRAFNRQSVWRRFAIVVAGPVANFILAVVLYWVLMLHGVPGLRPAMAEPPAGTPAAQAQLAAGDLVLRVGTTPVNTWHELRWHLLQVAVDHAAVTLEVESLDRSIHVRHLDFAHVTTDSLDENFLDAAGLKRFQPPLPPVIGHVAEGSVAAAAGVQVGDRIDAIGDTPVADWQQLVGIVRAHGGRALELHVVRGEVTRTLVATPESVAENGARIGKLGIGPKVDEAAMARYLTQVSFGPVDAIGEAVAKTWEASAFTVRMMGKMITGQISVRNLSGPLTIADYAGQSAQMGWIAYLGFLALISISLGVLNLMPVPLLDGGHLMYYFVEIIKGKPVSERVLEIGQQVGMVVLFSLMAFAIYNDIHRLFGGS